MMPLDGAAVQRGDQMQCLQAMSVALEHPYLSTDPKLLCSAACACKAWQQAVQQCPACNTVVVLNHGATLPQLCAFAHWLPKHAALVKSIKATAMTDQRIFPVHGLDWMAHWEVAAQLVQHGLAAAASPPQTAPGMPLSASSRAAAALPTQQVQQLRLSSFSSNYAVTSGVLAGLPAHSLTHLDLERSLDMPAAGPALAAALAQLTSLQHVRLANGPWSVPMPGSCLAALSQLRQLTYLSIDGVSWPSMQPHLQQLLSAAPPLRQLHLGMPFKPQHPPLDMRRLTQLQELTADQLPRNSLLPAQLQRLRLDQFQLPASLASVVQLQQLQHLSIIINSTSREPAPLLLLARLPGLTHLDLHYIDFVDAAATAAAWPQLPQLRELRLGNEDEEEDAPSAQMSGVLASIAGCSSLTKLWLKVKASDVEAPDVSEPGDPTFVGYAACSSLAALTGLHNLTLRSEGELAQGDAQALSCLTRLTRLALSGLCQGLDDVAATAIAVCCRQLRHLEIGCCWLGSMACLAAIGQLTQLSELRLQDRNLTRRGLMLLTGLSGLERLNVMRTAEVTSDALEEFWAAVKRQLPAGAAGP